MKLKFKNFCLDINNFNDDDDDGDDDNDCEEDECSGSLSNMIISLRIQNTIGLGIPNGGWQRNCMDDLPSSNAILTDFGSK
ncbi:hypothetical protein DERF_007381 [Dermatophagoides farinae]|uniref:Uncharacterized protein n=1 Tax=Dermatophagoides farinae TaxID=6954 RepID=A0A922I087_DERFA|nr:hypothetical protein DERF_007381 [Dermatophagoides farinae]